MTLFKYDPEKIDPELREQIEEMPEHKLYFVINHAGGVRFQLKHRSSHPERWTANPLSVRDSLTAEEEMFQMQAHCIEQLKAKGILENPTDADGVPTDEYWKWFKGWHSHVEGLVEGLSEEEWTAFDKAMGADEDVSRWYPKDKIDTDYGLYSLRQITKPKELEGTELNWLLKSDKLEGDIVGIIEREVYVRTERPKDDIDTDYVQEIPYKMCGEVVEVPVATYPDGRLKIETERAIKDDEGTLWIANEDEVARFSLNPRRGGGQ